MPIVISSHPAYAAWVQREFESECIHLFSEIVQVLGVPRSVGQIYGLLFASSQPLSFSDFLDWLEISKGSVSQGLHLLRSLGAIKQLPLADEQTSGTARSYYGPELGLRKLMSGVLRKRIAPIAASGADRFVRLRRLPSSMYAVPFFAEQGKATRDLA
jgi:HTH-type transcriptional regulator, glycine betaine synthesis regulator